MEHHDATGVHQVSIKIGQEELVLETGKMAKQANGSVFARLGGSAVIATACAAENEKEDLDFIPLSVDYLEKYYAAGKIPGGFIKRESRPSDKATLTARQIDRPIRPSFPKGFMNEVQVIATVLSIDQEYAYDVLAMTGASAALTLSEIPFLGPLAAVRVGLIDGEYVVNPLLSQLEEATLDLVVSGSRDAVVSPMVWERPWPMMSYWKACTSSWPMTWSVSASGPAKGTTMRRLRASVTPPTPSPRSP